MIVSWLVVFVVIILRATCRVRFHEDPRPNLRLNGERYVYSVLHAHQVMAILGAEPGTGAMVSRSGDGQILVPVLRMQGVIPVRGSARNAAGGKGGLEALHELVEHVLGGQPAMLAVDGPRGPRGHVHKGIAVLSQRTGGAVINFVAVSRRRWILSKTWDRLQIPKPFSRIDAYFSPPLFPRVGESTEEFRRRIEENLRSLEKEHDGEEAAIPPRQRQRRLQAA